MKLKEGVISIVLSSLLTTSALAQTRGGTLTLRYTSFSPIVSLAAGILILLFPKLLRYIVGGYLILFGLLGLLGRYQLAAAAVENRRTLDETRPMLWAAPGGEPCRAAPLRRRAVQNFGAAGPAPNT